MGTRRQKHEAENCGGRRKEGKPEDNGTVGVLICVQSRRKASRNPARRESRRERGAWIERQQATRRRDGSQTPDVFFRFCPDEGRVN